ncbi:MULTISPECIES: hypothetical protein [unclassified Lysobacter]|uniref:hypothetical protein n=1 Tax=unclassified Lysobacter TaxID=2635362 RepID=UPI001BEAC310|nr:MULTISPECIES: hypothetical protein [unclassified Lysobacter]MBT2750052.1 hypothetical protein [Lysobacter sp. ISL-50]MBT2775376.1 hypothetical protein [Lysobacter sp. ISL-54]MBT2783499.1 hypothetical protein [Lysobacter sp. ISL-52]
MRSAGDHRGWFELVGGENVLDAVDKENLLAALKKRIADDAERLHAALEDDDPGEQRLRWSNYADNLRALERITDPEQAIVLVEQEDSEFYEEQLVSSRVYAELAVKVPNPLSGRLLFEGHEYELTNHTSWHDTVAPGAVFKGGARRDERWWTQLTIIDKR